MRLDLSVAHLVLQADVQDYVEATQVKGAQLIFLICICTYLATILQSADSTSIVPSLSTQ